MTTYHQLNWFTNRDWDINAYKHWMDRMLLFSFMDRLLLVRLLQWLEIMNILDCFLFVCWICLNRLRRSGNLNRRKVNWHSLSITWKSIMKSYWFCFIYNIQKINDLLEPGNTNLKITEDSRFGVTGLNLKRFEVSCFKDALMAFRLGEEQRAYKETSIHEHSSRSHTLF
jgi:hypothetical protein